MLPGFLFKLLFCFQDDLADNIGFVNMLQTCKAFYTQNTNLKVLQLIVEKRVV